MTVEALVVGRTAVVRQQVIERVSGAHHDLIGLGAPITVTIRFGLSSGDGVENLPRR